jgi:hypothetical protein
MSLRVQYDENCKNECGVLPVSGRVLGLALGHCIVCFVRVIMFDSWPC